MSVDIGSKWRNRRTGVVSEVVRVHGANVYFRRGKSGERAKYLPHLHFDYTRVDEDAAAVKAKTGTMTPEQRKMVASHVADTVATHPWGAAIRACLAAADRASYPQAEADRRLGAAVMRTIRTGGSTSHEPDELDDYAKSLWDDGSFFAAEVLRAIAAALREEAGR